MRYGTDETIGGNRCRPFPVSCDIDLQARIPFDEELLPHWKEFASALERFGVVLSYYQNTKTRFLVLGIGTIG